MADIVYTAGALHGPRVMAEFARARYGVWLGIVRRSGEVIPLGADAGPGPSPCELLRTRHDQSGSCSSSARRWGQAGHDGDVPRGDISELRCHAGLVGLLRPLVADGEVFATLYASGFWNERKRGDGESYLARRIHGLGLKGARISDVPALDPDGRERLVRLMQAIATEIESFAATPDSTSTGRAPARYHDIIGRSGAIMDLFSVLDKVASSESTCLIQGENGTGKELIARAVHFNSRRADLPFVVQNCSALNDNLLDSELFGHKKGAFTGAVIDKRGLFDIANGGTFFLDEVGDMSPTLQVKMLRVLQEGTFLPVGDTVTRKVDVRIIAATNRDLKSMVREGSFREDLFYRLNVINLVVPPLRRRRSDIPILVDHFMTRSCRKMGLATKKLGEAAQRRILNYPWPGNIRELENEVERLVVLAGDEMEVADTLLSPRILRNDDSPRSPLDEIETPQNDLPGALESLERRMLLDGLRRTGWNKTRTAKELGISRRNLIRKVDRYQLDKLRDS
jgi:two-component system, NtrC family, response regulator HupR/HoxA